MDTDIDKDTALLLAEFAAHTGVDFDDQTFREKRESLAVMLLEAGAVAPDVPSQEFYVPSRRGGKISGYAYHPDPRKPSPVLFLIQGGGWSLSGAKPYGPLAAVLAVKLQRLVVCVDFGLAPEHPFPAGLHDCCDVYAWLCQYAAELGGDPSRITLMGDSAGGNLAAAIALSRDEEGYKKPESLILIYPTLDVREDSDTHYLSRTLFGGGDYFLTRAAIRSAADAYVTDAQLLSHPLISLPVNTSLALLPQTLIITAGLDPLRDEGYAFSLQLQAAGVDVSYKEFEGTIHGFLSFFHRIKLAHEAIDLMGDYMS